MSPVAVQVSMGARDIQAATLGLRRRGRSGDRGRGRGTGALDVALAGRSSEVPAELVGRGF